MNVPDMREALNEAERTFFAAEHHATTMARLLRGRLRKVDSCYRHVLAELKAELRNFDSRTGRWRE